MSIKIGGEVRSAAIDVLEACRARKLTVATAESCTGGLVAGALTAIAGSSDVVDRGFVTYSNEAKQELLGVPLETLKRYGAVSRQTAEAMAGGVLTKCKVDLAVSVTGIAGPGGGSPDKPVGLVHFAVLSRDGTSLHATKHYSDMSRDAVRDKSVLQALAMLKEVAEQ